MKSIVLSEYSNWLLPTIGCLIFVIMFVCMLFWVFRSESVAVYKNISDLPFQDGEKVKGEKK